jgi:hypothetical protein
MNPDTAPVKVSFSFYPSDVSALSERLVALRRGGLSVRNGTVLRALIYLTPPMEMFAHSVLMAGEYAKKNGPREDDNIVDHPTVDLPKPHIKKLDDVVTELAAKGITANRAFVVRAMLRAAPSGTALVPAVKKFLADFPAKPRGRAALKAKKHARN